MKSFIRDKLNKVAHGGSNGPSSSSPPAQGQDAAAADTPVNLPPVSQQEVFQHRYHFGTNLGSVFVLEKWLYSRMFDGSAQGSSELDAVTASLGERGLDATKQRWAEHWRGALTDGDVAFLRDTARCTTVRLPLGYFTLGPRFCPRGTPFHGEAAAVYEGAWQAVLDACGRLAGAGIGVLLDLHAVPGGANGNDHSGTTSGRAAHWESRSLRDLSTACLVFMAGEVAAGRLPNAVGLQFCNEACHGAAHMYDWYEEAANKVGTAAPGLPLYVSDAWDLKAALKWSIGWNSVKNLGRCNPVVVDTHKYYTFSEEHRSKAPQELIAQAAQALRPVEEARGSVHNRGAAECFVGEWSVVMDGRTWGRVDEAQKDGLTREFGQTQCRRWEQASGGHAYWTAKMQWMDGGGWGFFAQVKAGNIAAPVYMALGFDEVTSRVGRAAGDLKSDLKSQAVASHTAYWDKTSPGKHFEHWRFEKGWDLGFDDALAFAGMRARWQGRMGSAGMDRIGMLEIWIWRRMGQSGQRGPFAWEWEQGFRQGVKAAEKAMEI